MLFAAREINCHGADSRDFVSAKTDPDIFTSWKHLESSSFTNYANFRIAVNPYYTKANSLGDPDVYIFSMLYNCWKYVACNFLCVLLLISIYGGKYEEIDRNYFYNYVKNLQKNVCDLRILYSRSFFFSFIVVFRLSDHQIIQPSICKTKSSFATIVIQFLTTQFANLNCLSTCRMVVIRELQPFRLRHCYSK